MLIVLVFCLAYTESAIWPTLRGGFDQVKSKFAIGGIHRADSLPGDAGRLRDMSPVYSIDFAHASFVAIDGA
jgi:hypothetical protein